MISINIHGKTPIDYLEDICKDEKPLNISFVIYDCSIEIIERIDLLCDKYIICSWNCFCSGFFKRMGRNRFDRLKISKAKIKYIESHAKIILCETEKSKYVITSSCNVAENYKYEITDIKNDSEIYDFYLKYYNSNSKE